MNLDNVSRKLVQNIEPLKPHRFNKLDSG